MSKASEAEQVDGWNREQFYGMDFSATQVEMLVRWGISAHAVEPLIKAGCPRHLVMRIIRPLDVRETPVPLVEQAEQYSVKV